MIIWIFIHRIYVQASPSVMLITVELQDLKYFICLDYLLKGLMATCNISFGIFLPTKFCQNVKI